jgi:predicted DsbA family dithiol-disulfide isomerase
MNTLTIDVVSDVVCPWCFIGKRHLDKALAQWRTEHVVLHRQAPPRQGAD